MLLDNKIHQWPRSLLTELHLGVSVAKCLCMWQVKQDFMLLEAFHCLGVDVGVL